MRIRGFCFALCGCAAAALLATASETQAVITNRANVKRSGFLSTSAALFGAAMFSDRVGLAKAEEISQVSNSTKPSIVFGHGIWADGRASAK